MEIMNMYLNIVKESKVLLTGLALLIIIDLITGLAYAIKNKSIKSSIMYNGLMKKFGEVMIVVVSIICQASLNINATIPVITMVFACEAISILENSGKLGAPVPKQLLKYLTDLQGGENNGSK